MSTHKFLAHNPGDDVAVAITDVAPGPAGGLVLADRATFEVVVLVPIPLGHKVALRDINRDAEVIEYGRPIGAATMDIREGEHVHVHNLQTLRWRPAASSPAGT